MTSNIILRCEALGTSYGRRAVFRSARLAFAAGVYALQGPNGIGKSTLLRLLAGAQLPDRGEVWIDGISLMQSPEEAKRRLSYVPDESPIYPFMTGWELLQFVASAKHTDIGATALALIDDLGLAAHVDARFDAMSLGTQKKMMLCTAWIGTPRVLLLDEPSNGLDLAARDKLVVLLREWSDRSTILFTAHDADFVAATGAAVVPTQQILEPEAASV